MGGCLRSALNPGGGLPGERDVSQELCTQTHTHSLSGTHASLAMSELVANKTRLYSPGWDIMCHAPNNVNW